MLGEFCAACRTTKKFASRHLQVVTCMGLIHVANSLLRVIGDEWTT
jgi:hypothetical protein